MGEHSLSRRTFLSAAAVAGVGAPLLSACGGGSGGDKSGSKKTTVEWWNIATTEPQKSMWPARAREYEAQHPNVTIKVTAVENEAFKAKMTALTQSGKVPHIFHTWGGGVLQQQVEAGLVKDITKAVESWPEPLVPIALEPYKFNGRIYAVPFDIGMVGFWYNKALFRKAGITTPPATWSEYLDDIKKLKNAGITPIALAGKDKWPGHYYWAYLALRIGGLNAYKQAAQTKDFTAPPFVEAGRRLKELVDLAPFQQGFQGAGFDSPGGEAATMGSGKAAMELMGQWAPTVEKAASGKGLGDDLGFFPFPTVEGGAGTATEVFGGGGGYALGKDAPDAALDFLKYFIRSDNDRKAVKVDAVMPVVKGAEDAIVDPNLKLVAKTLDGATGFQLYLDQYFPPAVGQEVNDSVAALIAGKRTPEQVAQAITKTAKTQ